MLWLHRLSDQLNGSNQVLLDATVFHCREVGIDHPQHISLQPGAYQAAFHKERRNYYRLRQLYEHCANNLLQVSALNSQSAANTYQQI